MRKAAVRLTFSALVMLLTLVVVEGLASTIWTFGPALRHFMRPLAERVHTQYDPDLGWANIPGIDIPDFYRPGHGITINRQGFRNDREFTPRIPDGWLRAICSGDSFTLGYGVGNRFTWCQQLAARQQRLETVNLGQGGYGIDQSFLLYRRTAGLIDHDLHIFAFVADDIDRMTRASFLGYGKPVVRLEGGKLVVEGVPVPRSSFQSPRLAELRMWILGRARLVQLFAYLSGKEQDPSVYQNLSECYDTLGAVFRELKDIGDRRGSTLLVVYLPTKLDLDRPSLISRYWRGELEAAGISFVDLTDAFRALSPERRERMYIPKGSVAFPGAVGHYSVAGNTLVADLLLEAIHRIPGMSSKLSRADTAGPSR
jgi:hypothetical protein